MGVLAGEAEAHEQDGRAEDLLECLGDETRTAIDALPETHRRTVIMADLQELVARAGKLSGQELAAIRLQISEKLSTAKEKLHHLSEDASVAAHKGVDNTEKLIKDHPFQSVGIAALAGLVLGALLSRR